VKKKKKVEIPWTPKPLPWPKSVPRLPRLAIDGLPRIHHIEGQMQLPGADWVALRGRS
jgi:hypothetical protein